MNFRSIADIDNDIANKQQELEQTTHEIQRSILVNGIIDLQSEKKSAEEALERAEVQEAEVESITLPYDYNDILGNPIANETIIELLQQSKRQANEERNTLVDKMNGYFKQRLDELTNEWDTARTQLQTQNGELQNKLDAETEQAQKDAVEISELTQQVAQIGLDLNQSRNDNDDLRAQVTQLTFEKNDLFNKRNAAANALIEANRQIEILKTPPSPKPSIISVNDHLADLAARAKQSTLDQINKNLARFDIPAIHIPDSPLAEPQIEPLTDVLDKEEAAETIPSSQSDQVDAAEPGMAESSSSGQGEGTEEGQITVTIDDSLPIAFTMGVARHIDHLGNIVSTLLDRVSELESRQAVA